MTDQRPGKLGRVLSFASSKSKKSNNQSQKENQNPAPRQAIHGQKKSQDGYGHSRTKTSDSSDTAGGHSGRKMRTHADPTLAMSEEQPATIALQESSLGQLRGIQHKDRYGNLITDPDLSNPTRHRFERPLDTIRSFEAAIDGTYGSRRMSYARADESTNGYSRPTSYFGGDRTNAQHQRGAYDNSHGSRGYQSRPESYVDAYGDSSQVNYSNQRPPRVPRHNPRTNSDPNYAPNPANGASYYPQPPYQIQNENPNSNSPSGSGNRSVDHWMNSTDPSSVNSSMDRLQQQLQQQQQQQQQPPPVPAHTNGHGQGNPHLEEPMPSGEAYGFSGFGTDPQLDQSQSGLLSYHQNVAQQQFPKPQPAAPIVPPKDVTNVTALATATTPPAEKRKSWFKRRLSRF